MESVMEPTNASSFEEQCVPVPEEGRPVIRPVDPHQAHSQRLESLGTLATGVAHELHSPIGIVMSLAHLIMDDESATERAQGFAAIIKAESERMAGLVRTVLSFSRQDAEPARPTDLRELLERTLALLRSALRKDGIKVVVQTPEILPRVQCRSQQIQQVLMNLLTNARDATNARYPTGSPDKKIRIVARSYVRANEAWVRMTVEDNGTGVHPDVSHRLFDPFFTTKREGRGTGLGLSISQGIIAEHGGQLRFESRPDVGARFHVDLRTES